MLYTITISDYIYFAILRLPELLYNSVSQVLDRNFALGNMILPVSLALLQYCASPQRYASDYQPPNYSLWLIEPHIRRSWPMALLVILYKVKSACNVPRICVRNSVWLL